MDAIKPRSCGNRAKGTLEEASTAKAKGRNGTHDEVSIRQPKLKRKTEDALKERKLCQCAI
jgi:hypothetical protein